MPTLTDQSTGPTEIQETLIRESVDTEQSRVLPAIELATAHDFTLVRTAIEDRADTLASLAKKNTDEGYVREARVIQGDSQRLREDILPQLETGQQELQLASVEELRFGIENALRSLVRRYVRPSNGEDDNPEAALSSDLAARIELYGRKIAEESFAAGVAYRVSSAELIAMKCVGKLSGQ